MKLRSLMVPAALAALAACATAGTPAAAPRDGDSLVRAMHARYDGRWYRTLAFTQKTTFSPPDRPERVETWEEYARIPGALRIERGGGRGAIYAGDSTFIIAGDTVARRVAGRNELMTLGFDVYAQAPDTSIVGERGILLEAADPGTVSATVSIATERRATSATVRECTLE